MNKLNRRIFTEAQLLRLAIIEAVMGTEDLDVLEDVAREIGVDLEALHAETTEEDPEPEAADAEAKETFVKAIKVNEPPGTWLIGLQGLKEDKSLDEIRAEQGNPTISWEEWREIADSIDWGDESLENMLATLTK